MNNITTELWLLDQFRSYFENDEFEQNLSLTDIITEFIQTKIIEYIATQDYGNKMTLIWWTSLRLLYNWIRKSRDLDYDSEDISKDKLIEICNDIIKYLKNSWYTIKKDNDWYFYTNCNEDSMYETIYHCKFTVETSFLKNNKNYKINSEVQIKIKMDVKNGIWNYNKEYITPLRQVYWIPVLTARIDSLLSKKISWFLWRTHTKSIAKDLIDILFLLEKTDPDFTLLDDNNWISNFTDLIKRLERKIDEIWIDEIEEKCEDIWFQLVDQSYQYTPLNFIENFKTIIWMK